MLIIIFSEKKGWGHVNVSVFAEEGDTIRDTFEAVKKVKEIAQCICVNDVQQTFIKKFALSNII